MIAPFDIFTLQGNTPIWRGTAQTLEQAKASITLLQATEPGEYVIFSQVTGNTFRIKPDAPNPRAKPNDAQP